MAYYIAFLMHIACN